MRLFTLTLKVYTEKTAKVEVTIPLPYLVLRAEETSIDLYGSIDLVVDKLERQVRKHKTKSIVNLVKKDSILCYQHFQKLRKKRKQD